jgi:ABC-2 type transport system ATP-binding protein
VFLTTHYIEEAERLCHRIAFIVRGRLVRVGSLEELMAEHQRGTMLELAADECGPGLAEALQRRFPGCAVHRADERHLRVVSDGSIELLPLLEAVAEAGERLLRRGSCVRPWRRCSCG